MSSLGLDGLSASSVCSLVLVTPPEAGNDYFLLSVKGQGTIQVSGLKISQRNGRVGIWTSRMKDKLKCLVYPELRVLALLLSGGLLPESRVDTVRARAPCSLPCGPAGAAEQLLP